MDDVEHGVHLGIHAIQYRRRVHSVLIVLTADLPTSCVHAAIFTYAL